MQNLDIYITLFVVAHLFVFVAYNKYRLRKIINHISSFHPDDNNARKHVFSLIQEHTSFFGYMKNFPDIETYSYLYDNKFFNLRKQWLWVKWYMIVLLIIFIIFQIFISFTL